MSVATQIIVDTEITEIEIRQEALIAISNISHEELQWALQRAEQLMIEGYDVDEAKSIIAEEAQRHPWKHRTH